MRRWSHGLMALSLCFALPSPALASYADDRAEIENLSARYIIALDAGDVDTYVSTFAPDGVLVWIGGTEQGRDAIRKGISGFGTGRKKLPADATERPRFIHVLTNHRIDVTGDTAKAVAIWLGFSNNNPDKSFAVVEFGHYEDELKKVDGHWLFSKRTIFNERLKNRQLFYPALGESDPRVLP